MVSYDDDDRAVAIDPEPTVVAVAPTMEAPPSNNTQIRNQVDETVVQVQEDISEIDLDDGSTSGKLQPCDWSGARHARHFHTARIGMAT